MSMKTYSIRMKKTHGGSRAVRVPGVGRFDLLEENKDSASYPEKQRALSEAQHRSLVEAGCFELREIDKTKSKAQADDMTAASAAKG